MKKVFNKLVRDNIPDIIKENNEIPVTKILSDEEYKKELLKKLLEEANEVNNSKTKGELLEELADVFEVLMSLAELEGEKLDTIIDIAKQKRLKRGGFSKRIFLEKTYEKGDSY